MLEFCRLFEEALNEVKQILAGVPFDCSDMEREGRLMHGWVKIEHFRFKISNFPKN